MQPEEIMNGIPIDKERLKEYDTWSFSVKRIPVIILKTVLILTGGLTLYLLFFGSYFWISGIVFIFLFPFLLLSGLEVKPERPYEYFVPVPTIIIETNPLKLITFTQVNMRSDEVIWGATIYTLEKTIPDTHLQIGEKVICSVWINGENVVFQVYEDLILYPLAWATGDQQAIKRVYDQIPSEDWERLESLIPFLTNPTKEQKEYFPEGLETGHFVYFDKDFNPDEELNRKVWHSEEE